MNSPHTPNSTHVTIAIDGNEANTTTRVGSNVYAYQLITALYQITSFRTDLTITVLLAQPHVADMPEPRENWNYVVVPPATLWTQWALPIHLFLNKDKYSVFFTPGHYAPRLCAVPYVSSVMDTAYLTHPDQFKKLDTLKLTQWTRYSVANATKVVAISEFTKQSVCTEYNKESSDIIVAYPGTTFTSHSITQRFINATLRKYRIKKPYLLFVGTLQPRKNIIKLVEAYEMFVRMVASRSLQKKKTAPIVPKLVLAGKVGWLAEPILERIAQSPYKKHIIQTGFITDKEKQVLYENAFVSTLLGLFEGFGIPPLESLYYGTPVVTANTTSLPEVVKDAGLLVDPHSTRDIAEAFYSVYTASSSQKLIWKRKGIKQTKAFSWKTSAEIVLEALYAIGSQKNS